MEILNDFNISVEKALSEIDEHWKDYDGLIVCGTHSPHDVEEMIEKIREAREIGRPFLGICFGLQLLIIEYSRNVLGIKDATSEELGVGSYVVKKMPKLRVGMYEVDGYGTMESHWHNYVFNNDYLEKFVTDATLHETKFERYIGQPLMIFADKILEKIQIGSCLAVQYHPEYQSSKEKPHPILVEFIKKCKEYEHRNG